MICPKCKSDEGVMNVHGDKWHCFTCDHDFYPTPVESYQSGYEKGVGKKTSTPNVYSPKCFLRGR